MGELISLLQQGKNKMHKAKEKLEKLIRWKIVDPDPLEMDGYVSLAESHSGFFSDDGLNAHTDLTKRPLSPKSKTDHEIYENEKTSCCCWWSRG